MPDLKVLIGGRNFNISCNPGEENAAQESANLLNHEAELLHAQLGRLPEDKMLLLSGLLLGDKIRALKHEQSALEEALSDTQSKVNELKSQSDADKTEFDNGLTEKANKGSMTAPEEKVLEDLQDISDSLDKLIKNILNLKTEEEKISKVVLDDPQESFL
jgi:cell division protein ZapA